METPDMISQLTTRVETLEAALQAVMQRLGTKPRVAKELSDDEAEARRLKINEASRISKLKARVKAAGFGEDIAAYQAFQATKRKGNAALLVEAVDKTPEPEAVPASRTVVEYDADVVDQPTAAEASQERSETDNLPSEAEASSNTGADPTPTEQAPAKNRKKK